MSATLAIGRPDETAVPLTAIAKRLPVSEAALRKLVAAGTIPSTRIGRTYWLFESDVRASVLGSLLR